MIGDQDWDDELLKKEKEEAEKGATTNPGNACKATVYFGGCVKKPVLLLLVLLFLAIIAALIVVSVVGPKSKYLVAISEEMHQYIQGNLICAKEIDHNVLSVIVGEHLPDTACKNKEELVCGRKRLAELRLWANGLHDRCIKIAYLKWIDYQDERADACEKILLIEPIDEWKAELEVKQQRDMAYENLHPTPKPPKAAPCESRLK